MGEAQAFRDDAPSRATTERGRAGVLWRCTITGSDSGGVTPTRYHGRTPKTTAGRGQRVAVSVANPARLRDNANRSPPRPFPMMPALFLIPLVALFRIFLAWQPVGSPLYPSWLVGFTPLAGVALCAGMFLPRRLALVIPLGALMLSDAIIDAHYGPQYHFFSDGPFANYALLALVGLGGMTLRRLLLARTPGFSPVLGATLLGSVFFYVASNTLAWIGTPAYPHTAAGWVQALTVGLPGYLPSYVFFRNGLVSDALYSMVFVACVRRTLPRGERIRSSSPVLVAGPGVTKQTAALP